MGQLINRDKLPAMPGVSQRFELRTLGSDVETAVEYEMSSRSPLVEEANGFEGDFEAQTVQATAFAGGI